MKSEFTKIIEQKFFDEFGEYPVWFNGQPEKKEDSLKRFRDINAKYIIDKVRPNTTKMGDMGI